MNAPGYNYEIIHRDTIDRLQVLQHTYMYNSGLKRLCCMLIVILHYICNLN